MEREIWGKPMWRERWKDGIMGGVRRGFSFIFYLLIAWRTVALTELRFKALSVHLYRFPNDAFIIQQHQPMNGWCCAHFLFPV